MTNIIKQPALVDEWGVPFFGKARTITGYLWCYVDGWVVRPLRPYMVETTPQDQSDTTKEEK